MRLIAIRTYTQTYRNTDLCIHLQKDMPQFTIIQTNRVTHKQTDLKTDIKVVRHKKRVRLTDRLIEGQEDWLTEMQKKIVENTDVLVERQTYKKKNTYTQYDITHRLLLIDR